MFNTHTHKRKRLRMLYRFIPFRIVSVSLIQQMTDSEWLFYALLRSIAIRIRHFSAPQCGWWSDRMFNPIVWDQHQSNCNCPGLHLLPVDVMVFSQNQIETGRNLEKILSKNDWITGLLDGSKPQQTSAATMMFALNHRRWHPHHRQVQPDLFFQTGSDGITTKLRRTIRRN